MAARDPTPKADDNMCPARVTVIAFFPLPCFYRLPTRELLCTSLDKVGGGDYSALLSPEEV